MRDIKFRVWDNVDYMSSNFTLQDMQDGLIGFTSDCVVMQYTGLKDKNGVEIYEGDVVKCWHDDDESRKVGVIKWGGDYPAFDVYDTNSLNFLTHIYEYNVLSCPDFNLEVIGNIHQNPEFLEG